MSGQGDATRNAAMLGGLGPQPATVLDPVKTKEMLDRLQMGAPPRPAPKADPRRERLRSLAREAIRCAVESVVRTRRDDGNRVDTKVLERALEALDEFRVACDPMTLLDVLDGEDE